MNAKIPLPIQIVVDDVGWWNGRDESEQQGPYRTGFVRNHGQLIIRPLLI